jgi:hypothetical protein
MLPLFIISILINLIGFYYLYKHPKCKDFIVYFLLYMYNILILTIYYLYKETVETNIKLDKTNMYFYIYNINIFISILILIFLLIKIYYLYSSNKK